jgi:HK97 family phage major capsid protein
MTDTTSALPRETKAASPEANAAFDELRATFEAWRDANDQRLAGLETRSGADVLSEEKLTRIDAALTETQARLDRLTLAAARPVLPVPSAVPAGQKGAFARYVRQGEAAALRPDELKQLTSGSAGGVLAPPEVEREIISRLTAISPLRALASVRTIAGGIWRAAITSGGPASGWAAETAARPETAAPTLSELSFPAMELYAMPAATQTLLDDAVVDLDAWIAGEVETVFAEQEGQAFITGNGTTQPRGILSVPVVADSSWSWGSLGVLNTGVAGAFPASSPGDLLMDLVFSLRAGYRQNGAFLMSRRTQSAIRRFKDNNGNYLWQPPAGVGQPATLLNFPLAEAEAMPNIAANSISVLFGDFRRGYLIVDRAGVNILRDPYSAKPYVLFYVTKRVGGGVQDFAAIKGLRFAA